MKIMLIISFTTKPKWLYRCEYLKQYLTDDTEIYVCGGTEFLKSIIGILKEIGVATERVHFESFIPKLSVGV